MTMEKEMGVSCLLFSNRLLFIYFSNFAFFGGIDKVQRQSKGSNSVFTDYERKEGWIWENTGRSGKWHQAGFSC